MNDLSDENMRDIFRAGFDNLTLRSHWKAIVAFARAAIEADRARNAPVAQAEWAGWLPIETAPHDGSRVLIYKPEDSRQKVLEAYWATPWDGAPDEQCWWSMPHGPAGRGYMILQEAVTHWMPLPAAPHPTQPADGRQP